MAKKKSNSKRSFGKRKPNERKRKKKTAKRPKRPIRRKTADPLGSRKPIEAKPTKYRGTEFKSRLEARWAVFLDYYHLMTGFAYEPHTFIIEEKGWDYTPDFFFQWGQLPGMLEVKPEVPSEEYLSVICQFVPIIPVQLTLTLGDFYRGNIPKLWVPALSKSFPNPKPSRVKSEALGLLTLWPDSEAAIKTAAEYRFDLDGQDPLPPFRSGGRSGPNPLDFMEAYRQEQQQATRGDRAELMEQRRKAMKEARRGKG